jgi:class 3 adenylate cyclase/pSer/pThr/pTyr-binding forkhead associated (FHA) protein
MAALILSLTDDPAVKWTLRDGPMTVGRASTCDIAVQHPSVSRAHARFTMTATGCRVSDLGSSNGTFVNGIRITTDADVRDGDAIAFGEVHAKVTAPLPPKPPSPSAPFGDAIGRDALDVTLLEQPGTLFWRVDAQESPSTGIRARDPHRLIALLSEAAKALMLHGSLNDILGRVVDLAVEHLSAERAVLMLTDASGNLTVQVQRPDPMSASRSPSQSPVTPVTGGLRAADVFAPPTPTTPALPENNTSPLTPLTHGRASDAVSRGTAGTSGTSTAASNATSPRTAPGSAPIGSTTVGPLPISRTVAHRVMTERVAFLAEDVAQHDMLHQAESVIMRRVQSLMCAPLWHEQRVSGVLYLEDGVQHKFNAADLEILVSLSNYAAVAIERSLLADKLLVEQRNRERLERYHSPAVVDRIAAQAIDGAFEAQERQVTVLFADLVGFTSIAETMPASEVARLLNDFFAEMTDAIFKHDGTLDKFMGDGLLAVFGAPLPQADHAARAVSAAIDMQRRLRRRAVQGKNPALTMRIGLSSGPVVAGDIGSPKRREYTVLGDTVNTAARLESSVAQPGQIVLTRVTLDRVVDTISARSLGMVELRGRRQAVEVFAIIDDD